MASFKSVVRNKNKNGYYNVYILIIHRGQPQYIKTHLSIDKSGLNTIYDKKGQEKLEISDNSVLLVCLNIINEYILKANRINISQMNCKELVEYLKSDEKISFTAFSRKFINTMYNEDRNSDNYRMALSRLHEFYNKENLLFSEITAKKLNEWIYSMRNTARAKNLYPTCIKTMFNAGKKEYNDYEKNIIRIINDPFVLVKIPKNDISEMKALQRTDTKKFFNASIIEINPKNGDITRMAVAKDVCKIVFCLCGINLADLYELEKAALSSNWKLTYYRKKTRGKLRGLAKMTITVPEIIRPLFIKYQGDERLFNFYSRYSTEKGFVKAVDRGIKEICDISGVKHFSYYSLRHTWATIARNDCSASMDLVSFCLIHASPFKITDMYVRKDFTIVDKINKKVIKYLFNRRISISNFKDIYQKRMERIRLKKLDTPKTLQ